MSKKFLIASGGLPAAAIILGRTSQHQAGWVLVQHWDLSLVMGEVFVGNAPLRARKWFGEMCLKEVAWLKRPVSPIRYRDLERSGGAYWLSHRPKFVLKGRARPIRYLDIGCVSPPILAFLLAPWSVFGWTLMACVSFVKLTWECVASRVSWIRMP